MLHLLNRPKREYVIHFVCSFTALACVRKRVPTCRTNGRLHCCYCANFWLAMTSMTNRRAFRRTLSKFLLSLRDRLTGGHRHYYFALLLRMVTRRHSFTFRDEEYADMTQSFGIFFNRSCISRLSPDSGAARRRRNALRETSGEGLRAVGECGSRNRTAFIHRVEKASSSSVLMLCVMARFRADQLLSSSSTYPTWHRRRFIASAEPSSRDSWNERVFLTERDPDLRLT